MHSEKSTVTVRKSLHPIGDSSAASLPAPVEERQRVEWHLKHLEMDLKLQQVKYKGLLMQPGRHIASQCVHLAGVQGFLRFWPNGYFNYTQSGRFKSEFDLGGMRADSWCAVGLFMPSGTHFKVRFFVGDERSEPRECYWSDGSLVRQIWMPDAKEPPQDLHDLVVGVEVFKNCRHLRPKEALPLPLRLSLHRGDTLMRCMEGELSPRKSPRESIPTVALSPSMSPRMQRTEVNGALQNSRTELGLALPSPRFMCSEEMRRMPPRCNVARTLLS